MASVLLQERGSTPLKMKSKLRDKDLISSDEAAKILGVPLLEIGELVFSGKLRLVNGFYLRRTEVEGFKEKNSR